MPVLGVRRTLELERELAGAVHGSPTWATHVSDTGARFLAYHRNESAADARRKRAVLDAGYARRVRELGSYIGRATAHERIDALTATLRDVVPPGVGARRG